MGLRRQVVDMKVHLPICAGLWIGRGEDDAVSRVSAKAALFRQQTIFDRLKNMGRLPQGGIIALHARLRYRRHSRCPPLRQGIWLGTFMDGSHLACPP